MIELTPEELDTFKKGFKESYGVEYTDEQAREASNNLYGFFQLLIQVDRRLKREKKNKRHANNTTGTSIT